ncbi:permease [Longibacter salinarum]|uniref:Permease n=1 Tax=Longibacter salinarum TaxID=1850348 RepID=A0A2A8CVR6_9BACT|nr:permease [Longibacter salinarum]PEN12684.1 permease [Longibacter salinarum]
MNPERVSRIEEHPAGKRSPDDGWDWRLSDLQGAQQLAVDGIVGMTDIVEAMHRNISGLAPIVGEGRRGQTRGITGFVYRTIRTLSRVTGIGAGAALRGLRPVLEKREQRGDVSPKREAVLAALNGVLGDYLEITKNPLALPMQFRVKGRPLVLDRDTLSRQMASPDSPPLVLLHGLCMNDLQWGREGHDHGAALARNLGYTPLYLHYNTGRSISENGREFAGLLERLMQEWPDAASELFVIGHSMGGLVARSACYHAQRVGHRWPKRLSTLVFLGTPHHGAPLERAGQWVDRLLGKSPYTAPIARVGMIRSAGINDLCHGTVVEGSETEPVTAVPLPKNVTCYAAAATLRNGRGIGPDVRGDGLVPVASALGWHNDPERSLGIPQPNQSLHSGLSHFDLLSDRGVYEQVRRWLGRNDGAE